MKITRKALRPASKLMPGTYPAVIVNVTASPNYFPQDAFVVEYNVSHRGHGILVSAQQSPAFRISQKCETISQNSKN